MDSNRKAADWIRLLDLSSHIEGGYYREIYSADLVIPKEHLGAAFKGARPVATGIYFLLEAPQFSKLHRIASDETWHFYAGDPLNIYEIERDGSLITHRLGNNPEREEKFHCVVKAGHWFAAALPAGSVYALTGCTVSPGFNFQEFELASASLLEKLYPQHRQLIQQLT